MKKRWKWNVLTAALLLSATGTQAVSSAKSPRTLLVVPARHSVLQIAFDLLPRRDVVLVSYSPAATGQTPLIHVWNGRSWLRISPADYAAGRFVRNLPARAILVGGVSYIPPELDAVTRWCPDVRRIPGMQTTELLNAFGRSFRFSPMEWKWFARRYNRSLDDLNSEKQKSWYGRPRDEFFGETDGSGAEPAEFSEPARLMNPAAEEEGWALPPAELIIPGEASRTEGMTDEAPVK